MSIKLCTLLLLVKACCGLQVVHNNPNMLNLTTPQVNAHQLFEMNNMYEDDDVDMVFPSDTFKSTTVASNLKTRPSILKVYSENVTLKVGQTALLKCETPFRKDRLKKELEVSDTNKISLDEYFKIKSIIWTQEFTQPRLLANNDDLFVKNQRFTLVKSSSFTYENSEYVGNIYKKQKYFDLKICPVKSIDSGWYSCYVVKKSFNDQNMKYYTYLDVIDEKKTNDEDYQFHNSQTADDDDEISYENCYNDLDRETTPADPTPVSLLNEVILSDKAFILTNSDSSSNEGPSTTINNLTYDEDDDSKNFTLKRQIDPPVAQDDKYRIVANEQANENALDEEINNNYQMTSPQQKIKSVKEKLSVYPKQLNTTQYNSFQFDCIYNGPQYLTVKMVWLKDGIVLEAKDRRIFTLDYKQQNNTRISILKFVYSLHTDSGDYKCMVSRKNIANHLSDTFSLHVHSSIENKSPMSNFFKFPFVDSVYVNTASYEASKLNIFSLTKYIYIFINIFLIFF